MLHHIELYVSQLSVSRQFWVPLLAQFGYVERDSWDDGFTLADGNDAYLTFVQRPEKYASRQYHRCGAGLNHLAFKVKNREALDQLREYCLENNVVCLYDDRYPFANGVDGYSALFVEDPDRIKVEFVAMQ